MPDYVGAGGDVEGSMTIAIVTTGGVVAEAEADMVMKGVGVLEIGR